MLSQVESSSSAAEAVLKLKFMGAVIVVVIVIPLMVEAVKFKRKSHLYIEGGYMRPNAFDATINRC